MRAQSAPSRLAAEQHGAESGSAGELDGTSADPKHLSQLLDYESPSVNYNHYNIINIIALTMY